MRDAGVHREMIVNGVTGYPADTPDEWARADVALARDIKLRRALGEEARKRVSLHYGTEVRGEQLVRVVENTDDCRD